MYEYGTISRPAMYGTVPEGFKLLSSPQNDECIDIIAYENRLQEAEIYRFQLIPISTNAYTFQVGSLVIVNGCDEAIVTGFASRGRYHVTFAFDNKTTSIVKRSELELI